MIFLTPADFKLLIKEDILEVITRQDPTILDAAELEAIEQIQGYIRQRYDVAAIFTPTPIPPATVPPPRNPSIVMYCIDIMLYNIHTRIVARDIPERRILRYEAAIDWLTKVQKGIITPNLPALLVGTAPNQTPTTKNRYGSLPPNQNNW
jgi:phage gp36-like protein